MKTSTTPKSSLIGLKKLRENMEECITRVKNGESLTIMRKNEAVFKITPVNAESESGWETVIDFTEINPDGVSAKTLLARLQPVHG